MHLKDGETSSPSPRKSVAILGSASGVIKAKLKSIFEGAGYIVVNEEETSTPQGMSGDACLPMHIDLDRLNTSSMSEQDEVAYRKNFKTGKRLRY